MYPESAFIPLKKYSLACHFVRGDIMTDYLSTMLSQIESALKNNSLRNRGINNEVREFIVCEPMVFFYVGKDIYLSTFLMKKNKLLPNDILSGSNIISNRLILTTGCYNPDRKKEFQNF